MFNQQIPPAKVKSKSGKENVIMEFLARVMQLSSSFREFIVPTYRPELHYMRGPGPAYIRRVAMLEGRRQGPAFGGDTTL